VTLALTAHGACARLAVSDEGAGIPEAFQPRVFQRFAQADGADTRQKGGTGLGLSISKSLVEEHGGQIGFETAPGKGTTFRVDLPLAGE
jgi:signal transduction histidine kinase